MLLINQHLRIEDFTITDWVVIGGIIVFNIITWFFHNDLLKIRTGCYTCLLFTFASFIMHSIAGCVIWGIVSLILIVVLIRMGEDV